MDTSMNRDSVIDGAKNAFFKAMLAGYAAGNGKRVGGVIVEAKKEENHTTITVRVNSYTVIDSWWTNPDSDFSGGSTVILHNGIPIWFMSYIGKYPKHVIPFLKKALSKSYEAQLFDGGRGPEMYDEGELSYFNRRSADTASFTAFNGKEVILEEGRVVGSHTYSGRLLF